MTELYRFFITNIAWNTLESFSYQLILLVHQLMLFKVTNQATFGLIGTFFATTYLIVMLVNFGLDISLAPFFSQGSKSKPNFIRMMSIQLIPEYIGLFFITIFLLIMQPYLQNIWPQVVISKSMLMLLAALIFFEGIKKTLRMILQLAGLSQKTALIEISTILFYTGTVWTAYFLGYPVSVQLVFFPMLISSIISSTMLGLFVYSYYTLLPDSHDQTLPANFSWRILKSRLFNFLNQASHSAFSSNFLVPCFAITFGLNHAGLIKLISAITHCVTSIVQRIFGISTSILLAKTKELDLELKRDAFFMVNSRLNQALYGIIIFFIINYGALRHFHASSQITWIIAMLFLIINISENFFIAYERFYIAEEKSDYLFFFNFIIMSLLGCILINAQDLSQTTLLAALICIRALAFCCITIFSFYRWKLQPALHIQPFSLITSLIISLAFFAVTS